jgi:hypothetical protein
LHNVWAALDTTTHQDHVIAHVVGAKVLAYFIRDETLYILLDIGFIWTIYLDFQMVLLPQSVAISELEVAEEMRRMVRAESDNLMGGGDYAALSYFVPAPVECVITAASLFAADDQRRLILRGEEASLAIETSLVTTDIQVYEFR